MRDLVKFWLVCEGFEKYLCWMRIKKKLLGLGIRRLLWFCDRWVGEGSGKGVKVWEMSWRLEGGMNR